jgi:hypothetical protein
MSATTEIDQAEIGRMQQLLQSYLPDSQVFDE